MTTVQMLLMLLCVALTSVAQVVLKLGATRAHLSSRAAEQAGWDAMLTMLTHPMVLLGLSLYVAATLVYLRVLSVLHLSQVYPVVALSYVFTMLAGVLWLGEPVVGSRVMGAALVLAGVGLISWR